MTTLLALAAAITIIGARRGYRWTILLAVVLTFAALSGCQFHAHVWRHW
jgi:hypothetical protein